MAGMKSHSMSVQLTSKNSLTLDELELFELSQLAGVVMEPATFKILLDLLKMNVSPQAVLQMLKTMCAGKKKKHREASQVEGENMPPPRQRVPSSKHRHHSGSSSRRASDSKR